MLVGVIDPELHLSIVDLGMVRDVDVTPTGVVTVTVALTTAGCPLRGQIKNDVESKVRGLAGVTDVHVEYGEMTQDERSAVMQRARWEARENAPDTEVPGTTRVLAIASGKGGVGKSSVTVNLAAALAAQGRTVGVLDADIWGFSVPRMLGVEGRLGGSDGKIEPNVVSVPNLDDPDGAPGTIKVVSMGFLVDDEGTALMWRGLVLARALEQFLTDVRWGDLDYLLDRHAARDRRHPDGAGAPAAERGDARGHDTRDRRAARRGARRRHGAPQLHEGHRGSSRT